MEEKNKKYTAADFEHYHSGTMPVNEMHELERAALDDPFLSDALEGYAFATNMEADISQLKIRLKEKQKNRKILSINAIAQNKWWRIAALFIIISGAGYFFYSLNSNKENTLANEAMISQDDKTEFDSTMKDSTAEGKGIVAFEKNDNKKNNPDLPKFSIEKDKVVSEPEARSESIAPAESKSKDDSYVDVAEKKRVNQSGQPDKPEYEIRGRVTDEEGKPISLATITDRENKKATITDTTGNFLFKSNDSSITAVASAVGYASKKIMLKEDSKPTIEMKKADSNLDEVATMSADEARKKEENAPVSKALSGKVAGLEISPNRTIPLLKNEQFDQYIRNNIVPISDENGKQFTGEVSLSFRINKKGRPTNIRVIKSSCKACEEQAIRLLENGPDWKPGDMKYGSVTIKF